MSNSLTNVIFQLSDKYLRPLANILVGNPSNTLDEHNEKSFMEIAVNQSTKANESAKASNGNAKNQNLITTDSSKKTNKKENTQDSWEILKTPDHYGKNNCEEKIQKTVLQSKKPESLETHTKNYANLKEETQEKLNNAQLLWHTDRELAKRYSNDFDIITDYAEYFIESTANFNKSLSDILDYTEENQSWENLHSFSQLDCDLKADIIPTLANNKLLDMSQEENLVYTNFGSYKIMLEISDYEPILQQPIASQNKTEQFNYNIIDSAYIGHDEQHYQPIADHEIGMQYGFSLGGLQPHAEYTNNSEISNIVTSKIKASLDIIVRSKADGADFAQTIRANLWPPQLGKIEINYAISSQNRHNLEINVEKIATFRLLQNNIEELRSIINKFAQNNHEQHRIIVTSGGALLNDKQNFNNSGNGHSTNPTINLNLSYNQNDKQNSNENFAYNGNDMELTTIHDDAAGICAYLICGQTRVDIYV